jgi:hypothetical protein
MKNLCLSLTIIVALHAAAYAAAPTTNSTRLQGTVTSVAASSITVSTPQGTQTVRLDPHVRFLDLRKSSLGKVQNGSFIGTTVVPQPDGSYRSTEVHIFADALRGMGEGFTKMNSSGSRMMANSTVHAPVNMMANSTVHGVAGDARGKTISMTFPGRNVTIHIPSNVPVSFISTATRSTLQNGKRVFLICNGAPGAFIAKTVVVIEKGASLGS